MKSVGEAMAIGRTFQESLQKALRSLETGLTGLDEIEIEGLGLGDDAKSAAILAAQATREARRAVATEIRKARETEPSIVLADIERRALMAGGSGGTVDLSAEDLQRIADRVRQLWNTPSPIWVAPCRISGAGSRTITRPHTACTSAGTLPPSRPPRSGSITATPMPLPASVFWNAGMISS